MPRQSKRISDTTDGSWVIEEPDSSEFASSELDSNEDSSLGPPSVGRRSEANRQRNVRKLDKPGNDAEAGDSSDEDQLNTSARYSTLTSEPELIMPSMRISQSLSPPTESKRAGSSSMSSQLRQRRNKGSRHTATKRRQTHDRPAATKASSGRSFTSLFWTGMLHPLLSFSTSLLFNVTNILKPLIAVCLAIWIVTLLGRQLVTSAISRTLSPICLLPGMSMLNLPFCQNHTPAGPVEFDQLMEVQSAFDDVLSSSSVGLSLPADMKRSESSIRDLRQVVQFSALPSRNELVFEFGGFIDTARQASGDLMRFNSRIGRAVDNVLSTNRWTLQVIDGVSEREASRGSISRFIQGTVLYPFLSERATEHLLFEQYLRHTGVIEEQITQLIAEAQTLLGVLQNLDDRLDVIQTITTRDGINLKGSRDELLSQLWTRLGGNRASKKKHDEQLRLLQRVTQYRKSAWDHVSGTLLKLQSIAAGLEDLRERVAAPEILGPSNEVPLRMHIEHIQLGVERLEAQRTESRKIESDYQRRIMGREESSQLSIS